MRLFRPNRLNVIFLLPVATVASKGGGCTTTMDNRVTLAADQVEELVIGNSVTIEGESAMAYLDPNGSLRGHDLPRGGSVGEWRLDEAGELCAIWIDQPNAEERCSAVEIVDVNHIAWEGSELLLVQGNPCDL